MRQYKAVWIIPKITLINLCKPVHDIKNSSVSICPFESGKCAKEGRKAQTFEFPENEKTFLMKQKTFFIVFEKLSFGKKIKIW